MDKQCILCGETKPVDSFLVCRDQLDGYYPECLACVDNKIVTRMQYKIYGLDSRNPWAKEVAHYSNHFSARRVQ